MSLHDANDTLKDVVVPLVSAVIGAITGAAAAYWPASRLATRASDEVLKRDAAARRDEELRSARQVFIKVSTLANSLGSFHKQIEEMSAKADHDGNKDMLLSQKLSTFPGVEREPSIEFTAKELALYITANRIDYVDDLLLLARKYAATLSSLATFAKLKTEFHYEAARHGNTTRDETGVSLTQIQATPEMANYFRVKSNEIEVYAQLMSSHLAEAFTFALDVADRFTTVTETYLGERSLGDDVVVWTKVNFYTSRHMR